MVFGVSIDPPESHTKFIAKHSLPFRSVKPEEHAETVIDNLRNFEP